MTRKASAPKKRQRSKAVAHAKLAVFLLVMPSLVLVFSLFLLAIINLVFNPTFWMTGDTEPVNPTPVAITALNTLFIATGLLGLVSLLPGAIAGIVLLVKSKHLK